MSKGFDIDFKPEGEVLRQYMLDRNFVTGICGPVGSGKTVGSIMKCLLLASMQEPSPLDGLRKTRWVLTRNTGPELKTTTIKTWLSWFPEDRFGKFTWSPPFNHHIRVDDIDMEVYFLALDDEKDVAKLLSLEATGFFINEASEVGKEIIDGCTQRAGRYPRIDDGGPSWYGVLFDTNAPPEDHWIPIMAGWSKAPEYLSEAEKKLLVSPKNWSFYRQPPGMTGDGIEKDFKVNPKAENYKNLPKGYYENMIQGKTLNWVYRWVCNRMSPIGGGKSVYDRFDEHDHVSRGTIEPLHGLDIICGLDFGLSPALIVTQFLTNELQWRVIKEVVAHNCSTKVFARRVNAVKREIDPDNQYRWRFYGDPTGKYRQANSDEAKSAVKIFRGEGIIVRTSVSNDPVIRREAVQSSIDRRGGLLIDPSCRVLILGFRGGYQYPRIKGPGPARYKDKVEKTNKYTHPHDALQYAQLGGGEGDRVTNREHRRGKVGNVCPDRGVKPWDRNFAGIQSKRRHRYGQ